MLAEINQDLDQLCRATVEVFMPHGPHSTAVVSLRAFTDGLALGAVAEPDRFSPTAITASLDAYLEQLERHTPDRM